MSYDIKECYTPDRDNNISAGIGKWFSREGSLWVNLTCIRDFDKSGGCHSNNEGKHPESGWEEESSGDG